MSAPVTVTHGDTPSAAQNCETSLDNGVERKTKCTYPGCHNTIDFENSGYFCKSCHKENKEHQDDWSDKERKKRADSLCCVDCGCFLGVVGAYRCFMCEKTREKENAPVREVTKHTVYKFTCKCGVLLYIGATNNVKKRERNHYAAGRKFWAGKSDKKKSFFSSVYFAAKGVINMEIIAEYDNALQASIREKQEIEKQKPVCNGSNSMTSYAGKGRFRSSEGSK